MKKLLLIAIGSFLTFGQVSTAQKKSTKKPNILFAIADDAGWKHFSAYGCKWVKTPAFDQVAKNGVLFNNAYTPNGKCAPSRACIITGRNSWQLEAAANHSPDFPTKFKTYAEVLGENGFFVGFTGKGWGPGNPGEINGKERELVGPEFNEFKLNPPTTGISNIDYTKNFDAFLEARPKGEPFCFWYGGKEPHRGYEFRSGAKVGGKTIDEINEVPTFWPDNEDVRNDMLDYAFEVEYFDKHLQNMLNKLAEIGELENTIVIVTSDNGMPFPRVKGQVYEYSNHMPLAIMWPNGIKNPGRVVDDLVSFIDFAPTYLELAGISEKKSGMEKLSGRSLTDILYSKKSGIVCKDRDYQLVGKERHDVGRPNDEGYPVRGIIKDGFLYLHNFKIDRWPVGNPELGYLNCDSSPTKTAVLDSRRKEGIMKYWELNFGKRGENELYNIKKDPYCVTNLASDTHYSKLMATMNKELTKKLIKENDPRILGNGDVFDHYPYFGEGVQNLYNNYMSGKPYKKARINKADIDLDMMDKK
ncbi:sulfatase [Flavobacterium sp. 7A]|uniref:sulfatase family protein n=1 Tax=Flavobacterium sp. 7A TaxID=2940571 RepID=UPI00222768D2|nr:sulfatase [Flavobacterium sp. 7A]MCW2119027.1 arylsulfatase A-like enzyme [Flavobacterium sp. 7A]